MEMERNKRMNAGDGWACKQLRALASAQEQ